MANIIFKSSGVSEFLKLADIGGHKVYHLEGSALIHSFMVYEQAKKIFPNDEEMQAIALLHDVGKIYTSVCNGPNDWSYPNHAKAGAEHLDLFIEKNDAYERAKWYVSQHIKPLFWRGKDLTQEFASLNCPEDCSIINLAKLAVCDIMGSYSVEPQDELLSFLHKLIHQMEFAIEEAKKYNLDWEVLQSMNQGLSPDEALDEWIK